MDGEGRSKARSLIERLRERPESFDLFQFIRRLDCACDRPLGTARDPAKEPFRFGQLPTMAFTGSSVAGVEDGDPPRILVNFLGLLGPNGPLPSHITRYVVDRIEQKKDHALARFLDLFHHRITCLFYRAWAIHQITASLDRPATDRFRSYFTSAAGTATMRSSEESGAIDDATVYYSGRFAGTSRNPDGLAAILSDFFDVPVQVEEYVGKWMEIPPDLVSRLGKTRICDSISNTTILGTRVWDRQQNFRLHLGPMGYDDYVSFLPGSPRLSRVGEWIRRYVGEELSWDLRLCLVKDEKPELRLGTSRRIGWDTWIGGRPQEESFDDVVVDPARTSPTPSIIGQRAG